MSFRSELKIVDYPPVDLYNTHNEYCFIRNVII